MRFSPNWGSASFNDKCQLTFMGAESNVAKIFFLLNVSAKCIIHLIDFETFIALIVEKSILKIMLLLFLYLEL